MSATPPDAAPEVETVRRVLRLATGWLAAKGVDAPRLDAELLLARVLGVKRLDLYLDHDRPLAEAELAPYRAFLKRRAGREPLAYILGERELHGLTFEVGPDVLIPRPDTELLVDVARDELRERATAGAAALAFADVGTGSGCVAIAILSDELSVPVRGWATDRSSAALAVARRNATRHGTAERLALLEGDLLAPVRAALEAGGGTGRLDLVVSNPPYVRPSERAGLDPELAFEPEGALFDTSDELPLTRRLALEARSLLAPRGLLAVETGAGSAALVRAHFERAGLVEVSTRKDLGGHERVVLGRAPG